MLSIDIIENLTNYYFCISENPLIIQLKIPENNLIRSKKYNHSKRINAKMKEKVVTVVTFRSFN